jgi:hypothetical protein
MPAGAIVSGVSALPNPSSKRDFRLVGNPRNGGAETLLVPGKKGTVRAIAKIYGTSWV